MERDKIPHADLCSDTEFLRRVSLDLTGRLPEVEAIRKFIKDKYRFFSYGDAMLLL